MKYHLYGLVAILLAGSAHAALPGNSADGKRFHDANCVACHDSKVYTRKDHKIQSLDALKTQLDSCGHMTKIELSMLDKLNVVKYLNEQFYKFH